MRSGAQVADPSQPGREASPFAALLRAELGRAIGPRHAVALAAMALMGCVLAFWLPTFPASIYRFFQRVFNLPGWAEIVVANDLAGLFFFLLDCGLRCPQHLLATRWGLALAACSLLAVSSLPSAISESERSSGFPI